jgi:hypothetical protein
MDISCHRDRGNALCTFDSATWQFVLVRLACVSYIHMLLEKAIEHFKQVLAHHIERSTMHAELARYGRNVPRPSKIGFSQVYLFVESLLQVKDQIGSAPCSRLA